MTYNFHRMSTNFAEASFLFSLIVAKLVSGVVSVEPSSEEKKKKTKKEYDTEIILFKKKMIPSQPLTW